MIYHIVSAADWQAQNEQGVFTAPSLLSQDFIHCSTAEQVAPVANFIFAGRTGLVLLCIDESKLSAELKYENFEGGERLFPHVYGPIERNAVVRVLPFEPTEAGVFELPTMLEH